ncbi:MAG TPA: glycosyltransferase family 4 protein, partial [Tepidisphaeraceae bacterium]|nr:glycosyltransferase family 4 protein [Tepidisphaeraceae bacterium]
AKMGGGEVALLNLVTHLDRARFRPVVALFSDGPLREKLERVKVETHVLPLSPSVVNVRKDTIGGSIFLRMSDVLATMRYVARLRSFIKRHRIDIVHTNSLKSDVIGGLAARLARVPVIWHVRDRIADDYLPGPTAHVFRRLCRIIPNRVITNSYSTLETLKIKSSFEAVVVPSGVIYDGTHIQRSIQKQTSGRSAIVGLVGRIAPWKGQHIFVEAANIVLKKYPTTQFKIIGSSLFGEDAYEQRLRDLVTQLEIGHAVEFCGFCTDVEQRIAQMDLLVHASTTGEPFGQVVIEGMAASKPVIATNGGGIPEIVIDGETGILVPMNDHIAMADAICRLLEDQELAESFGRCGRERVQSKFTIQKTVKKVMQVYDELLSRRTRPR